MTPVANYVIADTSFSSLLFLSSHKHLFIILFVFLRNTFFLSFSIRFGSFTSLIQFYRFVWLIHLFIAIALWSVRGTCAQLHFTSVMCTWPTGLVVRYGWTQIKVNDMTWYTDTQLRYSSKPIHLTTNHLASNVYSNESPANKCRICYSIIIFFFVFRFSLFLFERVRLDWKENFF